MAPMVQVSPTDRSRDAAAATSVPASAEAVASPALPVGSGSTGGDAGESPGSGEDHH